VSTETTTTPARQFFDQHLNYLFQGQLDELMQEQYTEDAVLTSPFDVLDTPGPHVLRGRDEIKNFIAHWAGKHGESEWEFQFWLETEDSISFAATMTNPTGTWAVSEAWHVVGGFPNGKIDRHYGFGYRFK
jgi:hypothetical protein